MTLLGHTLLAAAQLRGAQLRARARKPRAVQERALRNLLARAKETHFGREHGFARVRTVADFQGAVPLRRYEDLKPWFERALNGERNVSWPGRIRYFGMSSGTTAGNKYLPISFDSIRQQQRGGFDPIASYLRFSGDTELLAAKALMLGSSTQLERRPSGALVGDNTGIMARHMPLLVRHAYLPSSRVRKIADWDSKIAAVARECVDQDVRLLAGTPSWFLGLLDSVLAEARRRGLRAETIHDVWPNLRLLTGGGVCYEPYRELIRSRLGRHVPYVDVYNATEGGIMGVQDRPDEPEMLLLPDNGLFYEFVPAMELSAPAPRRLPMWEVEPGGVYALAMSTMSGIFAYLIGDCLRFTSVFPHRFVFEGRTAAFLNIAGEHVSQGELERAVEVACRRLSVRMRDFTVAADVGGSNGHSKRHIFYVEFDGPSPNPARCAQLIDHTLLAHNDDYATHRGSAAGLEPPEVRVLGQGAFHEWMRERGKLGGQNKVPRLLLDRAQRTMLERFVTQNVTTSADGANGDAR